MKSLRGWEFDEMEGKSTATENQIPIILVEISLKHLNISLTKRDPKKPESGFRKKS
jgi:hypothetical protein